MAPKRLAILGSSGSIGRRALDVARDFVGDFEIVSLSVNRNVALLMEQIREFRPRAACVADESAAAEARDAAEAAGIPIFTGPEGLRRLVGSEFDLDMAVVATVGFAGLLPSLAAIEAGRDLALANKEVLVTAGEMVMRAARERGTAILPIDSEHNAIFQCLDGADRGAIRRILLTASGGPFRTFSKEQLAHVEVKQALAHPTWTMGAKITIDSSTLMNKGFEAIEAHHLFGVAMSQIEVVVHPESTIHSMVDFVDGSILAQMGVTDMYLPIQNVLTHPLRKPNAFAPLDFAALGALRFERPDLERFPCLRLAYEAAERGGDAPAALNAANEVAVERFLRGKIRYLDIPAIIEAALNEHEINPRPSLDDILATDARARERAERYGIRA